MLFFKGKEDMGLEASLKLMDLPPDATIDDANQAYTYLHRMIDLFHQDTGTGDRQEDLDLLTCAYEKAVAYLSDRDSRPAAAAAIPLRSPAVGALKPTDLHFTINFSDDAEKGALPAAGPQLTEPNDQAVEDAISITSRRLHQTESALPVAQQAVDSATAAVEAANRRLEREKQVRLNAVVAAKSAKTRALLLEIEAKRAMTDAIAVAEKARDRVVAIRQAARDAGVEADKAREQACRVGRSEETAAAGVVCAEDQLDKAKARLKALTHTLLQTRSRMKMFQGARVETQDPEARIHFPASGTNERVATPHPLDREAVSRQQILSDLLEIEASLDARKREPSPAHAKGVALPESAGRVAERREHHRIVYPLDRRPLLSVDGLTIPILDLSTTGMRLKPDDAMAGVRIVRGVITFAGHPPVKVTGKAIRKDGDGLGLRLVTRIGNHILDQERLRLCA